LIEPTAARRSASRTWARADAAFWCWWPWRSAGGRAAQPRRVWTRWSAGSWSGGAATSGDGSSTWPMCTAGGARPADAHAPGDDPHTGSPRRVRVRAWRLHARLIATLLLSAGTDSAGPWQPRGSRSGRSVARADGQAVLGAEGAKPATGASSSGALCESPVQAFRGDPKHAPLVGRNAVALSAATRRRG